MNIVTSSFQSVKNNGKFFPMMQVNNPELAGLIDDYIRFGLFVDDNEDYIIFNPFEDENWRILLISENNIIRHIVKEINKKVYEMQTNVKVSEAEVMEIFFSQISELRMRENYSIEVSKSIYERLPYPSNLGGLERLFIECVDIDGRVDAFIKVNEYYHTFAKIDYIREDGLMARYFPDFIVKISNDIYVVETKADKDKSLYNVQSKKLATIDYLDKINQLPGQSRMDSKWNYVLLGESTLKGMLNNGASIKEILDYSTITESKAKGNLDDYLS